MRKSVVLFFVLCCSSLLASAQQKPADSNKWDVFAGYSFSKSYIINEPELPLPTMLNGGQGSATYFFNKYVGATAEMAGYTDDKGQITYSSIGYLFGPTVRFGFKHSRYSVFAHQLFGVTHLSMKADDGENCYNRSACTTNSFTSVSGGGVDVKLSKHISVRPAQMEYFNQAISVGALFNENAYSLKLVNEGFRYSAGAVVRF